MLNTFNETENKGNDCMKASKDIIKREYILTMI
jgi:hypothetical protein